MINAPNAITLARFALIPAIALELHQRHDNTAFVLFIISAASDLADGLIARRWNLRTRFGAIADPLADKLTMLTAALMLTLQDSLPWWFTLALVLRDVLIVGGALAYQVVIGPVEIAPTALSKLNTGLQFLLVLSVLTIRAGHVSEGVWADVLLLTTLATIVLSGGQYVLLWGSKAAEARKGSA